MPEPCISRVDGSPRQRWTYNTLEELVHSWCYSEDLESLEHAATELLHFLLGPVSTHDQTTELPHALIVIYVRVGA
jgi:hypothetical protein